MVDPVLGTSFVTIVGVWIVTVISPGPNFIATAHSAVAISRRAGLLVAAGVSVGTFLWATVSLLGLGLLFQSAGWLYQAVKLLGAGYLVYIGFRMVFGARRKTAVSVGCASAAPHGNGRGAFRLGLLTDLSNPKAAAFFTSLFAVAVPPAAPLWFGLLVVASVVAIAGGWYALAACLVSWAPVARVYRRSRRAISVIAGAVFVTLGLRLALAER